LKYKVLLDKNLFDSFLGFSEPEKHRLILFIYTFSVIEELWCHILQKTLSYYIEVFFSLVII